MTSKNQHTNEHTHEHNSEHELPDEIDSPPTGLITILVVASFLFVFAVWTIAYPAIAGLVRKDQSAFRSGQSNPERIEYIKKQNETLSSSAHLDDGFYQIPINDAMKIVVERQGDVF